PDTLEKVLKKSALTRKDIDCYVFHQANKMILDYLQDKCGLQGMPYWNDVRNYGNTVSSSIPIALSDMMNLKGNVEMKRVLMIGFGVGLSWGGCIADLSRCNIH
ncbi:MAG: 3-oxoacyl-ACP synthase, partial [Synergistaceae bacterium]|nr:3-oxoacyl-ACP synthase [Synergistaceae bacterium]